MKKILKWVGIVFLIFIALGVLGAIFGAGKKGNQQVAPTSQTSTQTGQETAPTQSPEQKMAGLNQTVKEGDLGFTVLAVNKQKTLGGAYTQKTAQGTYYVVTLKLDNTGKKTATFDSSMAKITDDQGREFDRSIDGQTALGMSNGKVDLFLQQIQPGLSYTGDLVFDLPDQVKNPVLVVKDSLFGQGAKISLE